MTPLRQPNPMAGHGYGATVPQTPMSSQLESVGWLREAVKEKLEEICKADDPQAVV